MKTNNTKKYVIVGTFALIVTMIFSISIGSVSVPVVEVIKIIFSNITGKKLEGANSAIITAVRLPRVINVALVGASLAISGTAMQGLLRNPLADGGTLGVTSGASLGAVVAIAFGIGIPGIPFGGTVIMSIIFGLLSIIIVLGMAKKPDYSMDTTAIILLGVIYSMFVSSIRAFLIIYASNKLEQITTWSMGSLSGSTYEGAMVIATVLAICSFNLISKSRELDAFAISEENAGNIGVDTKKEKRFIMVNVSAIVGVAAAFSGSIGFVGLIVPHMLRKIIGPGHKNLLINSIFGGAIFLLIADLISRVIFSPLELPIGIVTSFFGAMLFVHIFYHLRRMD